MLGSGHPISCQLYVLCEPSASNCGPYIVTYCFPVVLKHKSELLAYIIIWNPRNCQTIHKYVWYKIIFLHKWKKSICEVIFVTEIEL